MKVAVIGSKGFIGRRLVVALRDAQHEVVELDLPRIDISKPCVDDPAYCELLRGTEVIYHLAVMNLEHCRRDPVGCIQNNITGTLNVMELAAKLGVRRVIYSSASSVYGNVPWQSVMETDATNPLTLYGTTKLAAEKIVQLYRKDFTLTTGIFRFSNIYGPGQVNGLIPALITKISAGEEVSITGDGSQSRDFVYVDDVVRVLVLSLKRPIYSFLVNLGSGVPVSVNSVLDLCSELLGKQAVVKYTPMELDRNAYCANISLLMQLYEDFQPLPLRKGLELTIAAWRAHNETA